MKHIKQFNNFGLNESISNFIWKDNDDCQEIFNYIKDTFDRKYLSVVADDGFRYDDGKLSLIIKKEFFSGPSGKGSETINIHVNGEKVKCSPIMRGRFWKFFKTPEKRDGLSSAMNSIKKRNDIDREDPPIDGFFSARMAHKPGD